MASKITSLLTISLAVSLTNCAPTLPDYSYPALMEKFTNTLLSDSYNNSILMSGVSSVKSRNIGDFRDELLKRDYNVSEKCMNKTLHWLERIVEIKPWAMAVLDAIGKPPAGAALGGFQWLGSYDECQHISNMTSEFSGTYCAATFSAPNVFPRSQLDLDTLTLEWGICVSNTCSEEDARSLVLTFLSLIPTTAIKMTNIHCQPDMFDLNFSALAITSICVYGSLNIMVCVGTIHEYCKRRRRNVARKRSAQSADQDSGNASGETSSSTSDSSTSAQDAAARIQEPVEEDKTKANPNMLSVNVPAVLESSWADEGQYDITETEALVNREENKEEVEDETNIGSRLLLSFSAITNLRLVSDVTPPTLTCLPGIKVITMTWVILGHTYFYALSDGLVSNLVLVQTMLNRWTFLTVLNASLSADTFFLISGCLVSYVTLRKLKTSSVNWFRFYVYRYLRLTPAFMLLMITYVGLVQIWSDGPVYPRYDFGFDPNCRHNWWTNLLYVNNLVNDDKMCMGWTWYLACEMQFYVLSPIVILLFYHCCWWAGGVFCLASVLLQCITTGVVAKADEMDTTYKSLFKNNHIYWSPWCRVGVYGIGMFLGYLLYLHHHNNKIKFDKKLAYVGWLLAFIASYAALQGPFPSYHGNPPSYDVAAAYLSLFRVTWAVGVAWMIFACETGYGGLVRSFLSMSLFRPLSRVCYCAFLLHPVILQIYLLSLRTTIYVNDFTIGYLWLGHVVTAFVFGLFGHLVLEAPFIRLANFVCRKPEK